MPAPEPRVTGRATAVAVVFVANGLGLPSFLPRLPERQSDLALSDAGLGLVLLGAAAGALAASPLAGRAVGRLGSRPVVLVASLTLAGSLWSAGAAPTPLLLFLALAVIGASDASMDIAMNANGAAYERAAGGSVMHRLHAAWSLGALAGAGVAAAAAGAGVALAWQLAALGVVIAACVAASLSGLVVGDRQAARPAADAAVRPHRGPAGPAVPAAAADHDPSPAGRPGRRRARRVARPLVMLALATVGGAIIEGAPSDWSAIRLDRLGQGPGVAALGFAAFLAGMLAGRLVGDPLTDRFGGAAVLRGGMSLVAVGLIAGALLDHPAVFAAGMVLTGAGASGLFPLAFSAAGSTPGVAPGAGAAAVSLAARLGFLIEPLVMGALSELVGLRWAFVAVAAVALSLAAAARLIVPPPTGGAAAGGPGGAAATGVHPG
jgi:MFS family permease